MGKSSGGTRVSSSRSARGLSASGWNFAVGNYGNTEVTAKGRDAEILYNSLSTSVERAVESKVGDIRSGGGQSGPSEDREYTIIFREGTTNEQIRTYLAEMSEGSRLYNETQITKGQRNIDAWNAYEEWYNKTNRAR